MALHTTMAKLLQAQGFSDILQNAVTANKNPFSVGMAKTIQRLSKFKAVGSEHAAAGILAGGLYGGYRGYGDEGTWQGAVKGATIGAAGARIGIAGFRGLNDTAAGRKLIERSKRFLIDQAKAVDKWGARQARSRAARGPRP